MDAIFFARTDNIVAAIHPDDANRMVDSCTAAESEVTLTMYQADAIVSGPVGKTHASIAHRDIHAGRI
jgi:predicted NAD/FAD-binding protein